MASRSSPTWPFGVTGRCDGTGVNFFASMQVCHRITASSGYPSGAVGSRATTMRSVACFALKDVWGTRDGQAITCDHGDCRVDDRCMPGSGVEPGSGRQGGARHRPGRGAEWWGSPRPADATRGERARAGRTRRPDRAAEAKPADEVDPIVTLVRQRLGAPQGSAADRDDYAGLVAFYGATAQPVWTGKDGFTSVLSAAMGEIRRADDWGLKAAAFELPARCRKGRPPKRWPTPRSSSASPCSNTAGTRAADASTRRRSVACSIRSRSSTIPRP